ncbi:MAG: hypothetical protein JXR22_03095 [Prolixibacteraceae bacterium]|nr:hypothetical protein [Prolixibacteraceae bacterium]
MKRDKALEALLVISTGLVLLYLINEKEWLLYLSLFIGLTGILFPLPGNLLAKGWYKLGEVLGWFVSKVILVLLFYLFLLPIALLNRIFQPDKLKLKRNQTSHWIVRNHQYSANDLKNSW